MKKKIDLELIKKECSSGKLPVVGDFKSNSKSLCFIGTYHIHETVNSNHEIFNLIKFSSPYKKLSNKLLAKNLNKNFDYARLYEEI